SVVLGGEHLRRPRVTANRLVAILAGEILDRRRAALAAGRLRVGQRRPGERAVVSSDGEDAGLAELVAVEAADLAGILALGAIDLPRDDEPPLVDGQAAAGSVALDRHVPGWGLDVGIKLAHPRLRGVHRDLAD